MIKTKMKTKLKRISEKNLFPILARGFTLGLGLVFTISFFLGSFSLKVSAEEVISGFLIKDFYDLNSAQAAGATGCRNLPNSTRIICNFAPQELMTTPVKQYFVPGCKSNQCNFQNQNFSRCFPVSNYVGLIDFYLCQNLVTTSTNNQGETTNNSSLTARLTDSSITCDVTLSNVERVSDSKINASYSMNCADSSGNLQNANNNCIVWVEQSSPNRPVLGCIGGASSKVVVFRDQYISAWESESCYAFRTASGGGTCIRKNELARVCDGIVGLGSLGRTLGSFRGEIPCGPNRSPSVTNLATLKAANPIFSDVVDTANDVTAPVASSSLSQNCRTAREEAVRNNQTQFECDNQTFTINQDGTTTRSDGVNYDSSGNVISQTSSEGRGLNPLGDLADFIWKIVALILGVLLWLVTTVSILVVWFLGSLSLFFLSLNPVSGDALEVVKVPWGILVGVGNIMILAAFIYVGFGYLLNIEGLKKNIGEFLQKIIYYALLLNFTLFGLATVVNIGYGFGDLIKVTYSGSTQGDVINSALMGRVMDSIGRISWIRCGKHGKPDCIFNSETGNYRIGIGMDGGAVGNLVFSEGSSGATQAAISEFIVLLMMVVVIMAFLRLFKIVIYRFVLIWMTLILSPVMLASVFSPIEGWQSFGKTLWDRFWKSVLFYPLFIFALILVGLLGGTATSRFSPAGGSYGDNMISTMVAIISTALGAVISVAALFFVVDYFGKQFDEDIGKVAEQAKPLWEGAKALSYRAGGIVRTGVGLGKFVLKQQNPQAVEKMEEAFRKNALLRTVGNALTGRTLYDLENKAIWAKEAFSGFTNREKSDVAGMKEAEIYRNTLFARGLPGVGNAIGNFLNETNLPLRSVSAETIARMRETGEDESLIQDAYDRAAGDAFTKERKANKTEIQRELETLSHQLKAAQTEEEKNRIYSSNNFRDFVNQTLESDFNDLMEMISADKNMTQGVKNLFDNEQIYGEARNNLINKYGAFISDEGVVTRNAQAHANDPTFRPSTANLMNETYRKAYEEQLRIADPKRYEAYLVGPKKALEAAFRRAEERLEGRKDRSLPYPNITSDMVEQVLNEDPGRVASYDQILQRRPGESELDYNRRLTQEFATEEGIRRNIGNSATLRNIANSVSTNPADVAARGRAIRSALETARDIQTAQLRAIGYNMKYKALKEITEDERILTNPTESRRLQKQVGYQEVRDNLLNEVRQTIISSGVSGEIAALLAEKVLGEAGFALNGDKNLNDAIQAVRDEFTSRGHAAVARQVENLVREIGDANAQGNIHRRIVTRGQEKVQKIMDERNIENEMRMSMQLAEDEKRAAMGMSRTIDPNTVFVNQ